MRAVSFITLSDKYKEKQQAREMLFQFNKENLNNLIIAAVENKNVSLAYIDRKVKHMQDLTYDEAYGGMLYVLAATNTLVFDALSVALKSKGVPFDHSRAIAMGSGFLQLMAVKESLSRLTPDEVAGMSAASMLDIVARLPLGESIFEICGMGGDKGFKSNGVSYKTINVSTLTALAMAALDIPTMKHGSYANTSAVGSTEAIELLGLNTSMSNIDEIITSFNSTKFVFTDAHWSKTLHDLSHYLMFETVNHVIGPMTAPISKDTKLYKVMGVNEKIHPSVIAKAYEILDREGLQKVGNVGIITGLDKDAEGINIYDFEQVKKHVLLDELSPYYSIVALVKDAKYIGTYLLTPMDFGISLNDLDLQIKNSKDELFQANIDTVNGTSASNVDYLAINVAFSLFIYKYLNERDAIINNQINDNYLRLAFEEAKESILKGALKDKINECVESTKKELLI